MRIAADGDRPTPNVTKPLGYSCSLGALGWSNKPLTSTIRFKKIKSTNPSDVEISAVSLITNKKDKNNSSKPEGDYLDDLTLFNDPLFLDDSILFEEEPENNTLFDNTLEN